MPRRFQGQSDGSLPRLPRNDAGPSGLGTVQDSSKASGAPGNTTDDGFSPQDKGPDHELNTADANYQEPLADLQMGTEDHADEADIGGIGDISMHDDSGDDGDESAQESSDEEPDAIINLDNIRDGQVQEALQDRTVQPTADDVLGAALYNDAINLDINQNEENQPFDGDDSSNKDDSLSGTDHGGVDTGVHEDYGAAAPDTSTLIEVVQDQDIKLSDFALTLATWAELHGLSREGWASLRESLHTCANEDGTVPEAIQQLPKQLSTLIEKYRSSLPLMNMREANIPLKAEKQPTASRTKRAQVVEALRRRLKERNEAAVAKALDAEARKQAAKKKRSDEAKARRAKAKKQKQKEKKREERLAAGQDPSDESESDQEMEDQPTLDTQPELPTQDVPISSEKVPDASCKLTFFDPPSVIKNLVASDIYMADMHHGPGHFVDRPQELYESRAWLSSVRSSDGHYPHLSNGVALLPGDFIYYWCGSEICYCHNIKHETEDTADLHIGRIISFGYDLQEKSVTNKSQEILALQIQPGMFDDHPDVKKLDLNPAPAEDELVLSEKLCYIPETAAYAGVQVFKDYRFGECQENPSHIQKSTKRGKEEKVFNKHEGSDIPERTESQIFVVRRIMSRALCHTHPIRGELEIDYYGRYLFEEEWDQTKPGAVPVCSFPFTTFIDGFGIFRNSYRSLMGLYITPSGLRSQDRLRPGNIIPLVLGPHGSDFADVIKGLGTLVDLDRGIKMDINGGEVWVCAWTLAFIGDMPQQAENSGFKSPRAMKYCRNCYIGKGHKTFDDHTNQTKFDTITHGRYHHQVKQMQQEMASLSQHDQDSYGGQWGMVNPHPALEIIAPALDIILSRPYDPCHSEYAGLFQLAHFILRDMLLKPTVIDEYTLEIRAFPFPPGSRPIQSPKHHLNSYDFSSHAIWGTIIPLFLQQWLKSSHLKDGVAQYFTEQGEDPVSSIVGLFRNMAKSTTVLLGQDAPAEDYENLEALVTQGRESFNKLCFLAAYGQRSSRAGSRAGSRAASVIPTQPPEALTGAPDAGAGDVQTSTQDVVNMNDANRPNMHIAIHYHDFAAEYAMMANCNTLTGEDLHRWFKRRVYETNYSNVEKILLMKLNCQLTLRLLLRNAFKHDHPDLTDQIHRLYQKCPTLFRRALARTDRNELEALQEQLDHEHDVTPSADSRHLDPSVINKIRKNDAKKQKHHVQGEGKPLPVTAQDMTVHFTRSLRAAYHEDYGFPEYHPSAWKPTSPIKWARKLAFNTAGDDPDRFVFSQHDFIRFRADRIGRIDHIFVFNVWGEEHIFAIVTPFNDEGELHEDLELPVVVEQEDDPLIIGLTAIEHALPYVVPVRETFVLVGWKFNWL